MFFFLFSESQVDELAMELMLLLVILPAVQDQSHTREWLKAAIRAWCGVAAWALDLKSYLFGEEEEVEEAAEAAEAAPVAAPPNDPLGDFDLQDFDDDDDVVDEDDDDLFEDEEEEEEEGVQPHAAVQAAVNEIQMGLGAAHEALLLNRDVPSGFQPYDKPAYFPIRVSSIYFIF